MIYLYAHGNEGHTSANKFYSLSTKVIINNYTIK